MQLAMDPLWSPPECSPPISFPSRQASALMLRATLSLSRVLKCENEDYNNSISTSFTHCSQNIFLTRACRCYYNFFALLNCRFFSSSDCRRRNAQNQRSSTFAQRVFWENVFNVTETRRWVLRYSSIILKTVNLQDTRS